MSLWNIFPYLFLGHLFGDYVLQTNYIAAKKSKNMKVLFLHIFLVFLSQLFFLIGKNFGVFSIFIIFALSFVHLSIDLLKFYCKKRFCMTWYYYLIDQSMHITSLLLTGLFLKPLQPIFPRTLVVILSVMIFNGYFVSILSHLITSNGKYTRDYIGYGLRMIAPVLYYFSRYSLIVYAFFCIFVLFKQPTKFNVLNYIFTIISTIILMEVML
ncbi:DUF3307 domain-containing protein [Fervidobacterium sp.]